MNIELTKGFTQKTCGSCGVIFFVPDELEKEFLKTGQSWHCPNGHIRSYTESEADKYKRLYEQTEKYRINAASQNERLKADVKALQAALDKCKKPRAKKAARKP